MPKANEKLLGAHAVTVARYIKINGMLYLIVKNSWSTSWGCNGYFYLPADYLTKSYQGNSYAFDFKVILTEEYIQNPTPAPVITPNVAQAIADAKTAYKQTSIAKAKPYIKSVITDLGGSL
jgi:C1A family cysteine protease